VQYSAAFSCEHHLCLGDITMDKSDKCMSVFLRRTKTDIENKGVFVHVGCSGSDSCCAFCSMSDYLMYRTASGISGDDASPLFVLPGGRPLYKSYVISATSLSAYAGLNLHCIVVTPSELEQRPQPGIITSKTGN
jgi:hypothetical protein